MAIASCSQNFASAYSEEPFYRNLDALQMSLHHHLEALWEMDELRMALRYCTSAMVCTRQTDTASDQNPSWKRKLSAFCTGLQHSCLWEIWTSPASVPV